MYKIYFTLHDIKEMNYKKYNQTKVQGLIHQNMSQQIHH